MVLNIRLNVFFFLLFCCSLYPSQGADQTAAGPAGQPVAVDQGYLDLSGRRLTDLGILGQVPELGDATSINVAHNQLSTEALNAQHLPRQVTTVDASHNALAEFPSQFLARLPRSTTYVDLSHNPIANPGQDFRVPQRSLRVKLSSTHLTAAGLETVRERLSRPGLFHRIIGRIGQYCSSPFPVEDKIVGAIAAVAGYIWLKRNFLPDPISKTARIVKMIQNALFMINGIYDVAHMGTHSEIQELAAVLMIYGGLLLSSDTADLAIKKAGVHQVFMDNAKKDVDFWLKMDAPMSAKACLKIGKVLSGISHALTGSMRAFGTLRLLSKGLVAAKEWLGRKCNEYVESRRNHLIEH